MKNFKKVLSLTLALVMVLSTMTTAFAAADQAKVLYDLDLFKGYSATEYMPGLEDETDAAQALVLIGRALGWEVDEAATTTFTDVPAYAAPYVAYAAAMGITDGISETEFGVDQIDGQRMVTWFLAAAGYDKAAVWADTETYAAEAGMTIPTGNLRSDVVAVLYAGLMVTPVDGTMTIIETLVADDAALTAVAVAAGLVDEVPEVLAVESVTATNLREVVVVFNKAVDTTEAETEANYAIDSNSPESAVLAADGVTLTLRMANGNALGNYSNTSDLVIQKEVGFEADTTISNFAVKDVVVPSIVSVETTGPRTIKVTFTEPLNESVTASDTVASFKLDAGAVALDSTAAAYSGTVLTLTSLSDLSEGSHTLELVSSNSLVDNAAYGAVPATVAFVHTPDTSALTVEVTDSTETAVEITFNKAIDSSTLAGNTNVYATHTYNTATNRVTGTAIVDSGDAQTFTITFATPLAPGTSSVYINYADDDGTLIADGYDNELADTVLTVTTIADVTVPTVESVVFTDSTSVTVTFSEAVTSATAEDASNYTLTDSDSDEINVSSADFDTDSTTVVILTTATMNGGTYSLKIEDAVDTSVAANEMADTTISFEATDAIAPTVTTETQQIASNKVKVTFSEAMDPTYVTDKDNWVRNGVVLADDDTIVMSGTKAVIITIDADDIDADDTVDDGVLDNEAFTLGRVKDVAGNWIEAFETALTVAELANIVPDYINLVSKSSIDLVFEDEVITGAVAADFEVTTTADFTALNAVTGVATNVVDGDTTLTVSFTTAITDTEVTGVWVRTASGNVTTGALNAYDTAVLIATPVADNTIDYVAPEILTAVASDADTDTFMDTMTVTFSEAMYHPSIQGSDFTVDGYDVLSIAYTSPTVVTLTLEELTVDNASATTDAGATPDVTLVDAVQDATAQYNEKASQDAVVATAF